MIAEIAGDGEDVVLPRGLSAAEWHAYRRENPPPHLRRENRLGRRCGHCGAELGPVTRLCARCSRAELEAASR